MAHTKEWKEKSLNTISNALRSGKVIGVASIRGLPAPQFQEIRKKLHGSASIYVSRAKLMRMALEQVEKQRNGVGRLAELVRNDQTAFIVSDTDPFKLYKLIESNKKPLPAKGGETAPQDIEIKAGETPFKPGPIVGELQKAGIPASIEGGKVVIKKDKLLVKKGEIITPQIAAALTRMEIYPLVAGLDVRVLFEDGMLFNAEVLKVDESKLKEDLAAASRQALSLALKARYYTPQTITALLAEGRNSAINLSVFVSFPTAETVAMLVSKAALQAAALERIANQNGG
ncbi:MAG: 50S ribosomal protein L10 [Methanomassiliicoccales archaeon]